MKIGIITGASSGIGKEFALQLQKEYSVDEIWLVARREDKLKHTVSMMDQTTGVAIVMDLTKRDDMEAFREKLQATSPEICFLVNSAGYGSIGLFEDIDTNAHLHMLDINIKALVEMTHICLPHMARESLIFQVSSINAFIPSPNGAVYAATKAFVMHFSHALYQELKSKGIHVITVSPGPVATEFIEIASNGKEKNNDAAADPCDVVRQAIDSAKKKKLNSTFGFIPKLNIVMSKLLPRKRLLSMVSNSK